MGSRFERVNPPPSRQEIPAAELWPRISQEARRQLEHFYPMLGEETETRLLGLLERGIFAMWSRGAARVKEDGTMEFWNPVEGSYQRYDQEYNRLMVDFLADFARRQRPPDEQETAA